MERRRLALVAFVSTALHVLAAFGSVFLLQPGTPIEPDAEARAAYLADHTEAWRLGWAIWACASLSLIALIVALAPQPSGEDADARSRPAPRPVGLMPPIAFGVAGLGADLLSQSVLVFLLPGAPIAYRPTIEAWSYVGEGVFANGLYTVALALTVRAAYRAGTIPRWLALGCLPVLAFGAAVTVASIPMRMDALYLATGALTVAMIAWTAALGVWAWRASS